MSKAAPVLYALELRPLTDEIASAVNEWMGREVVVFDDFAIPGQEEV